MGEIKSVKVDNWGVFFLQKLQNFFNKTDYCDLTLQFHDNSQLKVHRLVLSACTDYFNVLENTCEMVDDALIMPNELQADVVVPIVNFMYTGTLEFELKMYGKLLRTAKEMNMTVLLKLLEAHRRTMEGVGRQQRPPSPKAIRRARPNLQASTHSQANTQQRRILTTSNTSTPALQQQRRILPAKSNTNTSTQLQQQVQYRQQIGSTSLLKTTSMGTTTSSVKVQYGMNIYGTQQEVKQEPEEYESKPQATSPFEQLRKGYNNNKRPATTSFVSPPTKKPNIEDVKEFAEQQRMRKQIAAEYGDDTEYEGAMDDDIHNDDDDDDVTMASSSNAAHATTSRQQQTQPQVPQGTTTITFKQEQGGDKPATIVVKDSSNSKMNHAKIISEVLRQYPNLVKGNKNIKLKIMPNTSGGQTQKIIVKKEPIDNNDDVGLTAGGFQQSQSKLSPKPIITSQTLLKPVEKVTSQQQSANKVQQQKTVISTGIQASVSGAAVTASGGVTAPQKRRIDSKTMHALIALGAENTTGPWLCLRCGVNGRPISIPSYRGFRRHLINTHKETIDSDLCEHCGWRSSNNRELHFHSQVEHKVKTSLYTFPECLLCSELFLDTNALNQHMLDSHPDENKQQCIYCNKIFAREQQLYTHMKTFHKKQALEDGIIDYTDVEFVSSHEDVEANIEEHLLQNDAKKDTDTKIKILSDISLPNASELIKLEPSSEATALTTIASGIATSMGISGSEEFIENTENAERTGEPKFVNAEGNEMHLTDEQRKEIMSQLNQENGNYVMVFNDNAFPVETAPEASSADTEMEEEIINPIAGKQTAEDATAEQEFDDSEIYELMSQTRNAGQDGKKNITIALDESKESADNLEWAENLISAHEMADEAAAGNKVAEEKSKKDDDISKKLKELTGDWTDDENDEEEEPVHEKNTTFSDGAVTEILEAEENKGNLQNKDNEENSEQEETQFEDDIEKAMKSMHRDEELEKDGVGEKNVVDVAEIVEEDERYVEAKEQEKLNDEKENTQKEDTTSEEVALKETDDDMLPNDEEEFQSLKVDKDKEDNGATDEKPERNVEEYEAKIDEGEEGNGQGTVEGNKNIVKDTEIVALNVKEEDVGEEKTTDLKTPVATTSVEPMETNDFDKEVTAKEIATENEVIQNEKESGADKSTSTKTEDKVKSLISEWVNDDDDEDENEDGRL